MVSNLRVRSEDRREPPTFHRVKNSLFLTTVSLRENCIQRGQPCTPLKRSDEESNTEVALSVVKDPDRIFRLSALFPIHVDDLVPNFHAERDHLSCLLQLQLCSSSVVFPSSVLVLTLILAYRFSFSTLSTVIFRTHNYRRFMATSSSDICTNIRTCMNTTPTG